MDLIFQKEPLQSYLDAYLYQDTPSSQKPVAERDLIPIREVSHFNLLSCDGFDR
jgi:hypothetical protein